MGIDTAHLSSPKQGASVSDKDEIDGLEFYRTQPPKGLLSRLPLLEQVSIINALKKRIHEVVQIERPDILHAHSPALNGVAACHVGKELNIPVVYEIRAFWEDAAVDHGTCKEGDLRYRLTRAMENYVVNRASAVTTICQGLKDDLVARGVPGEKITQIPNAVELHKFTGQQFDPERVSALREELDLTDNYVLGFLGSFYAYEGIDLAIRALPTVLRKRHNVKLLLVGGGPQGANLKALVKELHLENHVVFIGRVPHDDVNNYYELVDLLVFPRKSMRLTELVTPLKPLEAMAQKKLLLASDVGGHKELIEDGKTGFLFPAGDISALAEKIIAISQTPEHDNIVDNGLQFVEQQRNWKVSVAPYESLYRSLL